jgi:hypothetical protein
LEVCPLSALVEQHARWKEAHARLIGTVVKPVPPPPTPLAKTAKTALVRLFEICADPPLWALLIAEACDAHRISRHALLSTSRSRPIVLIRHELMHRLRTEARMSLVAIGKRLRRDYSTVSHGVARHTERLARRGRLAA